MVNVLSFVILKGIAIFTSPYITNALSTADYGDMSAYNTWASVICTVGGLGSYTGLTNYKVNKEGEYHRYCWNSIIVGTMAHIVLFILAFVSMRWVCRLVELPMWTIPLMVISAFSQYVVSFFSTYLILETEATWNLVISIFVSVGGFGLSVCLLNYCEFLESARYMSFILGHTVTGLVVSVYALFYYAVKGWGRVNKSYTLFMLRMGVPIVFHLLAAVIISDSDRIMLKSMLGPSNSGSYSFAYMFASIICSVWSAVNSIWSPYYYSFINKNDFSELRRKRRNFDFLYASLMIGFVMVCPEVYRLLANERYWTAIGLVPFLTIAFVFNHLYSFPQGYETYKENTVFVALGTVGSALVNIVLNMILIPKLGSLGAATATIISYVVLYVFHKLIAEKVIRNYPLSEYKDYVFVTVCIVGVCFYYLFESNWMIRWSVAVVDGTLLFCRVIRNKSIL